MMTKDNIKKWFDFKPQEQLAIFQETGRITGLPASAIEKDWWVTMTLRLVFNLPFAEQLVFKGGTSLSKGWNLIERFSEDIDLAIDRELLGFAGELSKNRVKLLRKASCSFISEDFLPAFISMSKEYGLPFTSIRIQDFKDSDTDPLVIVLSYNSLTEDSPYLKPRVLIEVGARSLMEPNRKIEIQSFIGQQMLHLAFADKPFLVPTVLPKRTFLEKAFLLHEEFQKSTDKIRVDRLSRHLYDLDKLSETSHCEEALADTVLYSSMIAHRERFNPIRGIVYANPYPGKINFVPPKETLKYWETDYKAMQESMIYGNSKSFKELISSIIELNRRFQSIKL